MKKIFWLACLISMVFQGSAYAEICIANRCTDATSIGSLSVTSMNGSWDCVGTGCSAFNQPSQYQMQSVVGVFLNQRIISPEMRETILIDPKFNGTIVKGMLTDGVSILPKKSRAKTKVGGIVHLQY